MLCDVAPSDPGKVPVIGCIAEQPGDRVGTVPGIIRVVVVRFRVAGGVRLIRGGDVGEVPPIIRLGRSSWAVRSEIQVKIGVRGGFIARLLGIVNLSRGGHDILSKDEIQEFLSSVERDDHILIWVSLK